MKRRYVLTKELRAAIRASETPMCLLGTLGDPDWRRLPVYVRPGKVFGQTIRDRIYWVGVHLGFPEDTQVEEIKK